MYPFQIATIEEAHRVHPSASWWVKADGCDIVSGLEESVRLEWNGDVDMGTGELQVMYQDYMGRLERIRSMRDRGIQDSLRVLLHEKVDLTEDLDYISQGKTSFIHSTAKCVDV